MNPSEIKSLLLLQFRNYGDAVIGLGLIEAMRSRPDIQIDVLSRPEFAFLFEHHPRIRNFYTASFPIGTMKNTSLRSLVHLGGELLRARRRDYDAVANLYGDVRENLAGWIVSPASNYALQWPADHPVRIMSRMGPAWLLSHPVSLYGADLNVYSATQQLAASLGATEPPSPRIYDKDGQRLEHRPIKGRIGLFVTAGQECKRWPMEKWVALGAGFLAEGRELRIYCAPFEEASVEAHFKPLLSNASAELVAVSPQVFLEDVSTCELFLGHDSFGIHAASAVGVPSILINGCNVASVWAPPGVTIQHGDESLACFPCYGKPVCTDTEAPYACIRCISVDQVRGLVAMQAEQ